MEGEEEERDGGGEAGRSRGFTLHSNRRTESRGRDKETLGAGMPPATKGVDGKGLPRNAETRSCRCLGREEEEWEGILTAFHAAWVVR